MKTLTISLTDEEYAGLTKAQLAHDLSLENTPDEKDQKNSPEAYAQFVMSRACESYSRQWASDTIEGLRNQLAASNEAQIRADAKAAQLAEQVESVKTQLLEKTNELESLSAELATSAST
ncbi:MAG: hypothetical protein E6Q97_33365, partial [Desulfurellales bacterium]